jgi:hypothetical protein
MSVKQYTKSNTPRKNYNYKDPSTPSTTTEEVRIQATGGSITTAGAYTIHTFTSNATFTVTQGTLQELDYFVIAGGGPAGRSVDTLGACGGGAGGALMNWLGITDNDVYPAKFSQCIGPKVYTKSGDVWTVNVGLGGTGLDSNSSNNCGGDSWILRNGGEQIRCYGGGGGGGGSAKFVGYNGGCSGGTAGASGSANTGTPNTWVSSPGYSILTGELQYHFTYGKTNWPYKQGNGNSVIGVTGINSRSNASAGCFTAGPYYWTGAVNTDTVRGNGSQPYPGYGIRTVFGGIYQTYGNGGFQGLQYQPSNGAAVPDTPTTPGSGGHSRNSTTTGAGGSGSNGVVIFRYLNNKTIAAANVELLLVAGGGGAGGINTGGGGGGGSVQYYGNETGNTGGTFVLYNGTYPVTVGAGGVLGPNSLVSNLGGASFITGVPCDTVTHYGSPKANTWGSFIAYGGGSKFRALEELHGSGHGVRSIASAFQYGLPHPDHGFRGGLGGSDVSGGGGGAGAVGGNGVAGTSGGAGGIGKAFSISGTSTYYGGGGGSGKVTAGGTTAAGGLGGGANGFNGTATTTFNGTVNTGGGGGGGYSQTSGGAGGSGIVILRYPDSYPAANGTTGSPTITTSGGWRTYTFTQSGSISFG